MDAVVVVVVVLVVVVLAVADEALLPQHMTTRGLLLLPPRLVVPPCCDRAPASCTLTAWTVRVRGCSDTHLCVAMCTCMMPLDGMPATCMYTYTPLAHATLITPLVWCHGDTHITTPCLLLCFNSP